MPSVEQVLGTLPPSFKEKYPNTYAIIDGSEIFIETPSDLFLQSSSWSDYKHHNTTKFLLACTPNGAVCFISPLYVGSISDVQLTKVSGFLTQLKDKPGIQIMADKGFTIKDILKELDIELNISPFLKDGKMSPSDVQKCRKIASHVERAIGRLKKYAICKQTIPISLSHLVNQIVCVCAYLVIFNQH